MKKTGRLLAATATATTAVLAIASPAFADFSVGTAYGNTGVPNGSATIDRTDLSVAVTVNLNAGDTFSDTSPNPNLQICASTAPFTARAAGKNACQSTPGGIFYSNFITPGTATSGTQTFALTSAYEGQTAYLQIQVTTDDPNATPAQTSFACWTNPPGASNFYGSCGVSSDGSQLPVGALGAIMLGAVGGGTLLLRQRRRRSPATTPAA